VVYGLGVLENRTPVELAVAAAVLGSLLAVAVPGFIRNLSASKLTEPVEGLDAIVTGAIAYAEGRPQELAFPPGAPLTPAEVPRGTRVVDPPEAWEHLTWRSLQFRRDDPHAFSFRFDSVFDPAQQTFVFTAAAHGDLDGDGVLSTFEVRGEKRPGAPARAIPGLVVDSEVE
jgi:hypothetical protein